MSYQIITKRSLIAIFSIVLFTVSLHGQGEESQDGGFDNPFPSVEPERVGIFY